MDTALIVALIAIEPTIGPPTASLYATIINIKDIYIHSTARQPPDHINLPLCHFLLSLATDIRVYGGRAGGCGSVCTRAHLCIYIYIYLCMYVCVCMYVCMYALKKKYA